MYSTRILKLYIWLVTCFLYHTDECWVQKRMSCLIFNHAVNVINKSPVEVTVLSCSHYLDRCHTCDKVARQVVARQSHATSGRASKSQVWQGVSHVASWRIAVPRLVFGIERCSILCDFDARQNRATKSQVWHRSYRLLWISELIVVHCSSRDQVIWLVVKRLWLNMFYILYEFFSPHAQRSFSMWTCYFSF